MEKLRPNRPRLIIGLLIAIFILLITGALLIVLSILGIVHVPWSQTWSTIFLTIIIPVVGALIPLSQWLISFYSHKHEPYTNSFTKFPTASASAVPNSLSSPQQASEHLPLSSPQLEQTAGGIATTEATPQVFQRVDWGEAPHIGNFLGAKRKLRS